MGRDRWDDWVCVSIGVDVNVRRPNHVRMGITVSVRRLCRCRVNMVCMNLHRRNSR